jgi:RNA polymerase sigma-70 factor (ECF subfamily)
METVLTAPAVATTSAAETQADIRLVDRYLAGDLTAFDEIMIRYERQIYRLCYRFTNNPDDARDLAQDVFVKAFEHLGNFRRESSLKTWLYRIATNHCINHVKSNSKEFVEVTDNIGQTHSTIQHELEAEEQRLQFRNMVRMLPPKQRGILELRIQEQLSYEEIARMSNRSVSTIKASVFFALEKLRKLAKASSSGRALKGQV